MPASAAPSGRTVPPITPLTPAALHREVERIGRDIARPAADDVDLRARFPIEAIEALRGAGALSAGVPTEFGGSDCDMVEQACLVTALARHCSAAAMVLGMHLIKVETFLQHGRDVPEMRDYLRTLAKEQRLVASVTSEVGVGGNLRASIAAVERNGSGFTLVKRSTCLSYGAEADDLLITCRRAPDSPPSDQVVVLARRGEFQLTRTGHWDPMGMRGTMSAPFDIAVHGATWEVLPESFGDIAARTMLPATHILWASIWLGIAEDAVHRAREVTQQRARKAPGGNPPRAALKLAEVHGTLQLMQSLVREAAREYRDAQAARDVDHLTSVGYGIRINNVKLMASQLAVQVATGALDVIGFLGYLNGGEGSVTRHVRDAYSAAHMISNERVLEANASMQMVYRAH